MKASQQIFRVRRSYNQWVNNQTLEDYALRFTAKASRKWSIARVANTALGAISFLALEAIGGAITISYGFDNALLSILIVSSIIFLAGIPVCYYAARYGVDIDLLTRGAGFGYIGSTATSLIYASFTFIFFALEAAIMAMALKLLTGLPLEWGYVISSIVIIPIVTHGITFISRFQLWTQPFWVILQLLPFAFILYHDMQSVVDWQSFEGLNNEYQGEVSLVYIGAASAVIFSLIAQIGEQVDYLRFLPEKTPQNRVRWWSALLLAGPGWIIIGAIKLIAGSLLAYLLLQQGLSAADAADPAHMYIVAFSYVTHSPDIALVIGGIFVILSQLKINVTNAYAGSIAWSNFFSRLTHSHPGRVVWLIFNVIIALLLMELGVYQAFEKTLGGFAIIAVGWMGTIVADLVINKPLKLSPKHIEFKRAHLHDINPVGLGSMLLSCLLGIICYSNLFGETLKALSHFITFFSCFLLAPAIAYSTKSRYYIARAASPLISTKSIHQCCICENDYEKEDIAFCPAYEGSICSLCCSLDARCHDSCKDVKKISTIIKDFFVENFPGKLSNSINSRFIKFVGLVLIIGIIGSIFMSLVYVNAAGDDPVINSRISSILWQVFIISLIIIGIIAWLFILAHESRIVAEEESRHQNLLLRQEIDAHDKTDRELQRAKEVAEAANNAKSRYLTGISHELRSPLNSILGYAQLLENDIDIPVEKQSKIAVIRRSSEHLADLIEGLLGISQIEAGRLHIHRNQVRINDLIDQIVYMFRLQAENKGLGFHYECLSTLPEFVTTDEKRLRQILINLLSNAVKFTEKGSVTLSVNYKNQVAEFSIIDTGIGISDNDIERIFKPFERVRTPDAPAANGTGLGLTIVKLLTEILGGDIQVKKTPSGGMAFIVTLMLSEMTNPDKEVAPSKTVYGYKGKPINLMVVDDDPIHRGLVTDILSPLGFIIMESISGNHCLEQFQEFPIDVFLMDISMPGLDGLETRDRLKKMGCNAPIIMLSANANETDKITNSKNNAQDYVVKPFKINQLLDKLSHTLNIEWNYEPKPPIIEITTLNTQANKENLESEFCKELIELAEIGHIAEIKRSLKRIKKDDNSNNTLIDQLYTLAEEVNLKKLIQLLRNLHDDS